jgi:hypothetical protein
MRDPVQLHHGMTILGDSVGANGCSPEEEVLSHAQGRRQKVVGLLTQASHLRYRFAGKELLFTLKKHIDRQR